MKTNNIFKVVVCSFMAMSLAACVEEAYVPAPAEDASKTFVRADETAPRNLDINGADILVPFVRNNASGALDVTVALADTSGLFSLKNTTVSFASGETTAYAEVSYSYDALVPETVYAISVSITNEDVTSQYAAASFPIACKKAWQDLGIAQWYDDWWIGGPFEKKLLKAPDGTETYRLINPWDKESVINGGLDFVSEVPYLEFFIDENGTITYSQLLNMGFMFSGRTCHMLHPSARNDAASAAKNVMVMDNVAQFVWYPIINYSDGSFSWWGTTSVAYISFPGGPDLAELLGL